MQTSALVSAQGPRWPSREYQKITASLLFLYDNKKEYAVFIDCPAGRKLPSMHCRFLNGCDFETLNLYGSRPSTRNHRARGSKYRRYGLAYFEPDNGGLNGVHDGTPNGRDCGIEHEVVDLKIGLSGANTVETDDNPNTYLSLLTGSQVDLAFSTGFIFDGAGDDLFVDEIGSGSETAKVHNSTDFAAFFTFLDRADGGNAINIFDFSDCALPGDLNVNAVRIEATSNGRSSPGFDLTFVRGLEGSVMEAPQGPSNVVPLPAGELLLPAALGGLVVLRRRNRRSS